MVVVVVVTITGEAVAVVASVDISVRLGGERRVGEWRDLLEAAKVHGIGAIRRVGVGPQVEGLGGVEDGGTLSVGLLELVKVGLIPVHHGPAFTRGRGKREHLQIGAGGRVASNTIETGQTIHLQSALELLPILHSGTRPLNRLRRVVHGRHSAECRLEQVGLQSSLGRRGKIVEGVGRLEAGGEWVEAHEGGILNELGHVRSSQLLLLLLLLKSPVGKGVRGRLERRLL